MPCRCFHSISSSFCTAVRHLSQAPFAICCQGMANLTAIHVGEGLRADRCSSQRFPRPAKWPPFRGTPVRIDLPQIVIAAENIPYREHRCQHRVVLIVVSMYSVATHQLQIFDRTQPFPNIRSDS